MARTAEGSPAVAVAALVHSLPNYMHAPQTEVLLLARPDGTPRGEAAAGGHASSAYREAMMAPYPSRPNVYDIV